MSGSLRSFWNDSSETIPGDKDVSNYAISIEAQIPASASLCDLGSGMGIDGLYFADHGHQVQLVDISDVALNQAEESAHKRGLTSSIGTCQADLDEGKIPLGANTYDVVYSRLALHYFRHEVLQKLFLEIHRILKPGGKAFITLKSPRDIGEMKFLRRSAEQPETGVFTEKGQIKTRFSQVKLTEILRSSGLKDEEFQVEEYEERLTGRVDKVKSGQSELLLNEVRIIKN